MKFYNLRKIALWLLLIFTFPAFVSLATIGGQASKSAYQIAIENGFVGTEKEWIASLQGTNGKSAYDIAVENGFVGTEKEWIASLQGTNGKDGKDGKNMIEGTYSMFLTAKTNGEIDENTTYVEFLNQFFNNSNDSVTANLTKSLFSVVSVFAYKNNNFTSNYSTAGSGVIYKLENNGDAIIITNYHVIYNSSSRNFYPYFKLTLYGQDDNLIPAEVYGASRKYDLALLKVTGSDILTKSNAQEIVMNETPVSLGQVCYSIGNTSEYGLTLTRGVISVESEIISMTIGGVSQRYREIRHDSYIYHGNSGGGLFNSNGELIGLTNGGRENTHLNYAIPINIVLSVTENLLQNKTTDLVSQVKFYQTGIENNLTSSETISIFDSEKSKVYIKEKVIISAIDQDSLIAKAGGVQVGDEILSINYNGVTYDSNENFSLRTYTLSELLLSSSEGDEITFTLKRSNNIEELPFIEEEPTIFDVTITLSTEYTSTLT